MLNYFFRGVFDFSSQGTIQVGAFLACVAVSLALGVFLAAMYACKTRHTWSFLTALALLPAVVCVVIMMVNGNVGAGVAVAGAFGLVRFRSAPGTAREIAAVFIAMGIGLMTGMGYLAYAVLFALILGAALFLCGRLGEWKERGGQGKVLHILIPENLDYEDVFTEVLEQFAAKYELESVKTSNMGSLFKLTYHVELKKEVSEKEFIDKLRCRNGNLEISLSRQETAALEL